MTALARFSVFCGVTFFMGCFPSVIKHNQHLAAKEAEDFAKSALVERNFDKAVRFAMAENATSTSSIRSRVESLHPSGKYPVSIAAVSYEPMPGSESMKIYLEGSGSDRSYHYLMVMTGAESKGYKASALYRSENPFPASEHIKPLR